MQIRPVSDYVANVDSHAEPNGSIAWQVTLAHLHLFLHLHGAAYRPVDAVEYNEKGIASSLDDCATMIIDGRVDNLAAQ